MANVDPKEMAERGGGGGNDLANIVDLLGCDQTEMNARRQPFVLDPCVRHAAEHGLQAAAQNVERCATFGRRRLNQINARGAKLQAVVTGIEDA